jgi:hypothetical protein
VSDVSDNPSVPPSSVKEFKKNSRRERISFTQWRKLEITPSVTGIFMSAERFNVML